MSEYTLIPKVTEEGALPPLVRNRLLSKIGLTFPDSIRESEGGVVDVTAGIQAWLDANAGKSCVIPAGVWAISSPLRVKTGTTLSCEPGATIHSLETSLASHITSYGSYWSSTKKEIADPVGTGDRVITTKTAHGYAVGDVVRIVSQRISTNAVDAGEWQLGWATVGGPGPFFAEFGRVHEVPDSTTVVLDSGLIFPGYRPDATEETDTDAGPSAYLIKTNGEGDDITIKGLRLTGPGQYGVRAIRGVNVVMEDITYDKPDSGRALSFVDCYLSEARNCYVLNRHIPLDHAEQNSCHIAGSQETGFRNVTVVRGSQSFDITYANVAPYASVGCYVDDCRAPSALFNPVTIHPGTYAAEVTGNKFLSCKGSGIGLRGNSSIVTGNQIVGSMVPGDTEVSHPGIYVYEGGGKGSLIADNHITNFRLGMRVNDGADKQFKGWVGATFRDNVLRGFIVGFMRTTQFGEPVPADPQGMTLRGNLFESSHPGSIGVVTCESGRGVNGLVISNNDFRLTGSGSVGVEVTPNSVGTEVTGNTFHEVGNVLAYGTVGTPSVRSVVRWSGNVVLKSFSRSLPPSTPNFAVESTDNQVLILSSSDAWHLDDFTQDGRWRAGANALVTSSRGFPVENTSGWLEVSRVDTSTTAPVIEQRFQQINSTGGTLYYRRFFGGSWSDWVTL